MKPARSISRIVLIVLLAGASLLWLRSIWRIDSFHWTDSRRFASLVSSGGRINFIGTTWRTGTSARPGWSIDGQPRIPPNVPHWERSESRYGRYRFAGFEWSPAVYPLDDSTFVTFYVPTYLLIAIPYWFIAAVLLVPLWLIPVIQSHRRRRRIDNMLCPSCGYDLRATANRCPECGSVPTT